MAPDACAALPREAMSDDIDRLESNIEATRTTVTGEETKLAKLRGRLGALRAAGHRGSNEAFIAKAFVVRSAAGRPMADPGPSQPQRIARLSMALRDVAGPSFGPRQRRRFLSFEKSATAWDGPTVRRRTRGLAAPCHRQVLYGGPVASPTLSEVEAAFAASAKDHAWRTGCQRRCCRGSAQLRVVCLVLAMSSLWGQGHGANQGRAAFPRLREAIDRNFKPGE